MFYLGMEHLILDTDNTSLTVVYFVCMYEYFLLINSCSRYCFYLTRGQLYKPKYKPKASGNKLVVAVFMLFVKVRINKIKEFKIENKNPLCCANRHLRDRYLKKPGHRYSSTKTSVHP